MNQDDLDTLVICSVRYALGRMSYVVGDVARIAATAAISDHARDVILRDLREAFDRDAVRGQDPDALRSSLGMECDREEWQGLYKRLQR